MKKIVFVCLYIMLVTSCNSRPSYQELCDRCYELEEENYTLEEQNSRLLEVLTVMKDRNEELDSKVSDLEDEIDELEDKVWELESIVERAKMRCILWDNDSYMALQVLNEY